MSVIARLLFLSACIYSGTCQQDACVSGANSLLQKTSILSKVSEQDSEFDLSLERADEQTETEHLQRHFYVQAQGGSVNGTGSRQNPFSSVKSCLTALKTAAAGSSCKLSGGRHRLESTVEVSSLGTSKTITADDPKDMPVIDGTKVIPASAWKWVSPSPTGCKTGCYEASLAGWETAPWQLFHGDKMMVNARWPNANWEDKSLFEATKSWAFASEESTFSGPSQCAKDPPNGGTDCTINGQKWEYKAATKMCVNINKMECRNAMKGGMVPNTKPAECKMVDNTPAHPETGSKPLDQESFGSLTGASVILNVGHWTSYTGKVKKHTGNTFTYDSRPGWNVLKFIADHTIYYLENHIEFLDAPGEWFYDRESKKVYLKTKDNENPSDYVDPLSARVVDYAFKITETADLTISHLKFFASTIFAAGSQSHLLTGMTWNELEFDYPSAQKRMLGDADSGFPTTMVNHPSKQEEDVENVIKNCKFRYTDASPTLDLSNPGFNIFNNQFEYIDWSAVSTITESKKLYRTACGQTPVPLTAKGCFSPGAATLELPAGSDSAPLVFTRNTVAHHGASNGVGVYGKGTSNTLSLNRIFGKTDLQLDGGLASIPAGAANGVIMDRNWLYDSMPARPHAAKWGARFDRGQSRCERTGWGENGEISRNVILNTNGINAKGNGHKIVQNTVLWSGHEAIDDSNTKAGSRDINLYGSEGGIGTCECSDGDCKQRPTTCCKAGDKWTFENKKTLMAGNAMDAGAGATGGLSWKISTQEVDQVYKSQGIEDVRYNSAGLIEEALRDPHNFDFRPAAGTVQAHQCIGAYSGGLSKGDEYWIPGHQDEMPTMPVPPDMSQTVKVTLDMLAFNPARGAVKHYLYLAKKKQLLQGSIPERRHRKAIFPAPKNVFIFPAGNGFIKEGTTVYWRVDPDFGDGKGQVRGPIWEFTVPSKVPTPTVDPCKKFQHSGGQIKDRKIHGSPNTYFPLLVPSNGGLSARYSLASVSVCISASYAKKDMMGSLNFKLRYKKSNGAVKTIFLAKPSGKVGKKVPSVAGCFKDNYNGAYTDQSAAWKPKAPLLDFFSNSDLETEALSVELHVFDKKKADNAAGHLDYWTLELCYSEAAQQTLPANDKGLCQQFPYN